MNGCNSSRCLPLPEKTFSHESLRRNESVTIVHCSRNTFKGTETNRNGRQRKLDNAETMFGEA